MSKSLENEGDKMVLHVVLIFISEKNEEKTVKKDKSSLPLSLRTHKGTALYLLGQVNRYPSRDSLAVQSRRHLCIYIYKYICLY